MQILDTIFTSYDRLLSPLPANLQILCAFAILAALVFTFFSILKQGHWIFITLFVIFFPGGWTALKIIGGGIWVFVKFLVTRIGVNL